MSDSTDSGEGIFTAERIIKCRNRKVFKPFAYIKISYSILENIYLSHIL